MIFGDYLKDKVYILDKQHVHISQFRDNNLIRGTSNPKSIHVGQAKDSF